MKGVTAIPIPDDYFSGYLSRNLAVPDNVLVFKRETRFELQQRCFEYRPHHRFQLVCNLGTEGFVSIDGQPYRLPASHALLIPPYRFHSFHSLEDEEILWLFLTFELPPNESLEDLEHQVFPLGETELSLLEQILTDFLSCVERNASANNLVLRTARLIAGLRQTPSLESTGSLSKENRGAVRQLRAIDRLLAANLPKGINIEAIARELNQSESGLRCKFREAFGVTLGAYIKQYRMVKAMAMLRTSGLAGSDIAAECGFASQSAFCRAFRQELGCSPHSYARANHR